MKIFLFVQGVRHVKELCIVRAATTQYPNFSCRINVNFYEYGTFFYKVFSFHLKAAYITHVIVLATLAVEQFVGNKQQLFNLIWAPEESEYLSLSTVSD